jgi:hypothetical protein
MAKKGERDQTTFSKDQTASSKANAQETPAATVEKENIDPKCAILHHLCLQPRSLICSILSRTCSPVRPQAPKAIVLPKPSRPANVPTANKTLAKATKDADQPKTDGARKIIALPKSNPRPAIAKQTAVSESAPAKGLFRTAASIVTQAVVSEEVVAVAASEEVTMEAAQTMQAGIIKASVPEEDVDMGF